MFDECIVLIPCNTLEDFPQKLSDDHARGLLGAWTAPWHPRFLAASGKLPQWFRADTVPATLQRRVLLVPEASRKRLPSQFAHETQTAEACHVIYGESRGDFLTRMAAALGLDVSRLGGQCEAPERTLCADDFFALGYTWLQVQLMTRRLRYTSNLDEIYFAGKVNAAATAFVEGRAVDAQTALHEAFDCLAEERDHYFSNDPHLVDLTLLAPTTLGASLERALQSVGCAHQVPTNFLIDPPLAAQLATSDSAACQRLRQLIDEQAVAVAGGGPAADVNLHHQTAAAAQRAIELARDQMTRHIGDRCDVYARSVGETPGDIGPVLARSGYIGAIPIDLAAGSGWREESKLIWHSGPPTMDALVARPIDASQSHGFLALAPDLGQSIDSGEIATALLVHWPDSLSDAYRDLRRAASWGLALGKFWKIDDYFRDGERPFHHFRGRADEGAENWLQRCVDAGASDPLSTAAAKYREATVAEAAGAIQAMATMVAPDADANAQDAGHAGAAAAGPSGAVDDPSGALDLAMKRLCKALGGVPAAEQALAGQTAAGQAVPAAGQAPPAKQLLLVNPHPISLRTYVRTSGGPAPGNAAVKAQIFAWSRLSGGHCDAAVDVPGGGFVFLDASHRPPRGSWFKKRRLASGTRLSNEFMEVELSPASGGVHGVYSGTGRNNRYALRLAYVGGETAGQDSQDEMVAESMQLIRGDEAAGEIRTSGKLVRAGQSIADFTILYRLARGSRWLQVQATLRPDPQVTLGPDPWRSYFAFRSAMAADATSLLVPLRDLLHRASSGKRIDAPAGLVIDEVDNQTLLYTQGRPAHQRVGDRFIDSLLFVRGETQRDFSMSIGFDVREPLSALRAMACPPPSLPLRSAPANPVGWLVACASPDVALTDFHVLSVRPLVLSLLVITTRGDSRKVQLRFCRDVVTAEREAARADIPSQTLTHQDDQVHISMAGHEVIRLRVTLQG